MGWSPKCYIRCFVKIILPVLEKKIFECFLTVYGRGGHLDHVTQILPSNFCSPYPWMLHIKFDFHWPNGFREDCVRTTDQPRSRDDLNLNYSHAFIYSISCLHLPLFRSQAARVIKKSIVFTFSHVKVYDGLASQMLHTKFPENRPAGSEDDF